MGRGSSIARLHYASVELIICRHLASKHAPTLGRVLDLGSGAGHWIEFYRRIGAQEVVGIEIAPTAHRHLQRKFGDGARVECGDLTDVMSRERDGFDVINAIGVLFHVIDDQAWERTIEHAARLLSPGGSFIVGGHFGFFDMNAQRGADNLIDKRLRSAQTWTRTLQRHGFRNIAVTRNREGRYSAVTLPENHILIAKR